MRDAAHRVDPHLLRHRDIGAAGISRDQRAARLPEVAFGIEMQHTHKYKKTTTISYLYWHCNKRLYHHFY